MTGNNERIKFDLEFQILNNNKENPPCIEIYVDEHNKYSDFLIHDTQNISFFHDCSFDTAHRLCCQFKIIDTINISDKIVCTNTQVHLAQVKIDEININQIINSKCYSKLESASNITELPELIYGTTHFGRSVSWYLDFTSPFYLYIMNCVGGNLL